jgi:hypothetical protein
MNQTQADDYALAALAALTSHIHNTCDCSLVEATLTAGITVTSLLAIVSPKTLSETIEDIRSDPPPADMPSISSEHIKEIARRLREKGISTHTTPPTTND